MNDFKNDVYQINMKISVESLVKDDFTFVCSCFISTQYSDDTTNCHTLYGKYKHYIIVMPNGKRKSVFSHAKFCVEIHNNLLPVDRHTLCVFTNFALTRNVLLN